MRYRRLLMSQRSATRSSIRTTDNTTSSVAPFVVSETRTIATLVVTDLAACTVAVGMALSMALALGSQLAGADLLLVASFALLAPLAFAASGLYPGLGLGEVEEFRRLSLATVAVWLILGALSIAMNGPGGLTVAAVGLLVASLTVPYGRWILRSTMRDRSWWGVPTLVFGAGASADTLIRHLRRHPSTLRRPVAVVAIDDEATSGTLHGVPVLPLPAAAYFRERGVRHALITGDATMQQMQERLRRENIHFPRLEAVPLDLPSIHGNAFAIRIGGVLNRPERSPQRTRVERVLKRTLDLILLVPSGLVAAPIVGLAALLIRSSDRGEPFYTQERIGRDGERFGVIKLRTMYMDAEERLAPYLASNPKARAEWKRSYKLDHDPRILPGIGTFLRASSLDELPQLWNIAKGEMSFVGPRPFPSYHLDAFPEVFRDLRTKVKPGLTGLWQISARADADVDLQEQLDSAYILHWSFWMDLLILLRTPEVVLTGKGAR